jgi:hypothetical protein
MNDDEGRILLRLFAGEARLLLYHSPLVIHRSSSFLFSRDVAYPDDSGQGTSLNTAA